MDNLDSMFSECESKMKKVVSEFYEYLDSVEMHSINSKVFENVSVLCDNSYTKIKYLASIEVKPPNTVFIIPWNKSSLNPMEKSIGKIDISATVKNDGNKLVVTVTPPTKQKRLLLSEKVKKVSEEKKVKIRSIRHFYNNKSKKKSLSSSLSTDDKKHFLNKIQRITDIEISKLSKLCRSKIESIESL